MKQVIIGNMKLKLSVFIIFYSFLCFSQELKYEEVVTVDSTTKEELYNRARTWVKQTFNKKNSSIDVDDERLGEISASGILDYRKQKSYFGSGCVEGPIRIKFSIFLKDGRYKYIFHSFEHKGSGGYGCRKTDYGIITTDEKAPQPSWGKPSDKAWNDIKEVLKENIELNASDLKEAMNKKHESNNNW
ncbi:DUF4468 domain-containing protein [Chryseobacterium sp. JV274]|uniref:DUF4468 domain-containing protein n=1 Tax=Chryseobacterium sp. JV274 TaxID=1932669 RepID=UPI000985D9D9|nr:DUF4468 domain-containing protein [Chryseobacterium sp. JV274]